MCGIAGIIGGDKNISKNEIMQMCDIIEHRGPDGFGYYYDENFVLGHRRLSIIDLTPKGQQPMHYLGKFVITYNGEIYNYLELRNELSLSGYTFNTQTDTEVILASYDQWGKDCLNHFNGMWAFAIYDRSKNIIFCARDRFGIKPLYYTTIKDKFAFASEIKQFTVMAGWKAIANKSRLFDFLISDGIRDHTNETLFEGVYQIRGGEFLEYDVSGHKYKISRWYYLNENKDRNIKFNDAKLKFKKLLTDSIQLRLRSDVKVGTCLSGGLDSSSIACIINDILKKSGKESVQESVSACYDNRQTDESEYIDEVVEKTNIISHKIFPKFEELYQKLDEIIWHQDEPFSSTSILAQWQVYEESKRKDITVMLDGQGADEYLAGYGSFQHMYFLELLLRGNLIKLLTNLNLYRQKYKSYYNSPIKILVNELSKKMLPKSFQIYLGYLVRKLKEDNFEIHLKREYLNKNIEQINDEYQKTIFGLSINQLLFTSLPRLLHHQDRNSMAHSIESRVPFLDYRLVEFVLGLSSDYKIQRAETKFILREAMKGLTPDKILNRFDKLGFSTPQDEWFSSNYQLLLCDVKGSMEILKPYFEEEFLNKLCNKQNLLGSGRIASFLWRIICVGRWVETFKVKI